MFRDARPPLRRAAIDTVEELRGCLRAFAAAEHVPMLHARVAPELETWLLGELLLELRMHAPFGYLVRHIEGVEALHQRVAHSRCRRLAEAVAPERLTLVLPFARAPRGALAPGLHRLLDSPETRGWRYVVTEPLTAPPARVASALGPWSVNLDVAVRDPMRVWSPDAAARLRAALRHGLTLVDAGAPARAVSRYALAAAIARARGWTELEREAGALVEECLGRALRRLPRRRPHESGVRPPVRRSAAEAS